MIRLDDSIVISSYFEARLSNSTVSLLPFGHSRHYPLEFNVNTKNILSGELNFYNSPFFNNFQLSNYIASDLCDLIINKTKDSTIVINLLDNCFGHSLLKLFDAAKLIEKEEKTSDLLLIVPRALRHFCKSLPGISYLFVNLKFSELEKCFVLNPEIKKITGNYKQAFIVGAETYSTFNFTSLNKYLNFFGEVVTNSEISNNIIFYYRSDYFRKWNGNRQGKNIVRLFEFLKSFFSPKVEFIVVGDFDSFQFPSWIKDKRAGKFSKETDLQYNTLFKSSLLCIGLTGSHMLFPSLLSRCTVHLHPVFKYKNMAEDIVVSEKAHEMLSAFKHLYYFGNYNCSDISPLALGKLILIHFQGMVEKEYKIEKSSKSQRDWVAENYPLFDYKRASECRIQQNIEGNRKINFRRLIDRYLGKTVK